MNNNIYPIDIDIKNENYINEPVVRKNDDVKFAISITDDGEPFDLSGVSTATIAIERRDGVTIIPKAGVLTGENQATFSISKSAIAVIGKATATVQLYGVGNRVSTLSFKFNVKKDPSGTDFMPDDEKGLIKVVLGDGPLAIQQAIDAAEYANTSAAGASQEADRAKFEADYIEDKRPLIEQSIADASTAKTTSEQTDIKSDHAVDVAETVRDEFDLVISETGDSIPEITQARGGEVNLNARLDKTTQKLADIANQDVVAQGVEILKNNPVGVDLWEGRMWFLKSPIVNHSFEHGLLGWTVLTPQGRGVTPTVTTEFSTEGSHSLKLHVAVGGYGFAGVSQSIVDGFDTLDRLRFDFKRSDFPIASTVEGASILFVAYNAGNTELGKYRYGLHSGNAPGQPVDKHLTTVTDATYSFDQNVKSDLISKGIVWSSVNKITIELRMNVAGAESYPPTCNFDNFRVG